MTVNAPRRYFMGTQPATDELIASIVHDCETRAIRRAVRDALLEKERARLAIQRDKTERERKRKRRRIAELVAWVTTSAAVLWMMMRSGQQ